MKDFKKRLSSAVVSLGMTVTAISCIPSITASASTVYGDVNKNYQV